MRGMKLAGCVVSTMAVIACAGRSGAVREAPKDGTVVAEPKYAYSCDQPVEGRLGVFPFRDKTKGKLELGGMEDVLIDELVRSNCFGAIERNQDSLAILFAEIDRCDPANPERQYFDCSSFASKGRQLGLTHYVFGDVVFYADKVSGTELAAKFADIVGVEHDEQYAAVALSLRAVQVETGEVAAAKVVYALVPSSKSGGEISMQGVTLRAVTQSSTPLGRALMTMVAHGVEGLRATWRAQAAPTAAEQPPPG